MLADSQQEFIFENAPQQQQDDMIMSATSSSSSFNSVEKEHYHKRSRQYHRKDHHLMPSTSTTATTTTTSTCSPHGKEKEEVKRYMTSSNKTNSNIEYPWIASLATRCGSCVYWRWDLCVLGPLASPFSLPAINAFPFLSLIYSPGVYSQAWKTKDSCQWQTMW